jgi:hypothetical protein
MTDRKRTVDERLADLDTRVANLERHTRAPAPDDAERAQAERDAELLSRAPTSYAEAVAQQAARRRRGDQADDDPGDPATGG